MKIPECPEILLEHPSDLRERADKIIMYHSFAYKWADEMDRYDYILSVDNSEIIDLLHQADESIDAIMGVRNSNGILSAIAAAGQMKGEWTVLGKYRDDIPNDIITDMVMLLGEYINVLVEQISGPIQGVTGDDYDSRY